MAAKYCGQRVCVSICPFVCLCVCLRISKTTRPNVTKFSVTVTYYRGLVVLSRQCDMLYTSGFVDDVMFPYNGGNRPESKTTRRPMFYLFRQVAAPRAKSAVSDCDFENARTAVCFVGCRRRDF